VATPDAAITALTRRGVGGVAWLAPLRPLWAEGPAGEALRRRIAWALVWLMAVAFTVIISVRMVTRFTTYHADAFDMGNVDQAVWNTLHGHLFRFTNRGLDDFNAPTRLSIHVEPILLLIAPLYLIYPGPPTLIITQTIALALGAIPLFALSLRRLPAHPFVGVALVFAYLISPLLLGSALWDFHAVALATPLLLLALWALDGRRYAWFWVGAVLAMATKEDVGLSLAIVGLLVALWPGESLRRRQFGALLVVVSAAYVALCFKVILPHFSIVNGGANNFWYRYSWLGKTPGDAIHNVFTQPLRVLAGVFSPGRIGYLATLLRAVGGLGLLAPFVLLCALPELAVNILTIHPEQYSGFFQYNAVIQAYVCVAAVYGVALLYRARRPNPLAPFPHPVGRGDVGVDGMSMADPSQADPPQADPSMADPSMAVTPQAVTPQADTSANEAAGVTAPPAAIATFTTAVTPTRPPFPHRVGRGRGLGLWARYERAARAVGRGWLWLLGRIPLSTRWIGPVVIVWLVAMSIWNVNSVGRIPPFWKAGAPPTAQQAKLYAQIDALLGSIPADATVAATDTLDPHLTDRYTIYLMPDTQSYQAEYVAVDLPDAISVSRPDDTTMYQRMLASGRYVVVGRAGPVTLLRRVGAPLAP